MIELLASEHMQRALAAAVLVGIVAPLVGIYLVQRRLSLIGDGLGHIALTGVAVGVLTGTQPVFTALIVSVIAAILIEILRSQGRSSADVILAIFFYGGIAGGLVLLSLDSGTPINVNYFLFGSIVTTTPLDLMVFGVLAIIVVGVSITLSDQLFAVSNDEEYARASGMPVRELNLLLAVLTAATVVISMRVIGLLLISAMMIIPNAIGQYLARSFRQALVLAIVSGLAAALGGTALSASANTPPGATVVLAAIGLFLLTVLGVWIKRMVHSSRHHPHHDHPHEHGPDCGHEAIPHGDHVDYLHNGHRHAAHGAGYDDH